MHFRRRNETGRMFGAVAALLAAALLFAVWRAEGVADFLSRILLRLGSPAWTVESQLSEKTGGAAEAFRTKKSLIQENKELRGEIAFLRVELLGRAVVERESEELKALLGRSAKKDFLLAAVLSKPNRAPYDTLIIDVGTNDGVSIGDRVFAFRDIAIGAVILADDTVSKVKLFSSPGDVIEVLVGDEHIATVAQGTGGGNFTLSMPRGVPVGIGDPIIFPALGTEIAGVVERVGGDPSSAFQSILFKSPVNISELRWVEVWVHR